MSNRQRRYLKPAKDRMKFITAIYFTEDKKQKVMYIDNPHDTAVQASNWSEDFLLMNKLQNASYKTFELGAKNLL